MVHPGYRGNRLQLILYLECLKARKKLLDETKALVVAACEINNLQSAKNIMHAGLQVCNLIDCVVNKESGETLSALVFASDGDTKKEVVELPDSEKVFGRDSDSTYRKNRIQEILDAGCLISRRNDKYYIVK